MTRENKVALVVGFALVLFVGILISDHLSAASRQEPAEFAQPALAAHVSTPTITDVGPPLPLPGGGQAGGAATESIDASPASSPAPSPPPPTAPAAEAAPAIHYVRPGESLSEICVRHYGDPAMAAEVASFNGIDDPDSVQAGRKLRLPPRGGAAHPPPETAPPAGPAATGASAAATYQVRPGDTLSAIAQRFLGSRGLWRDLYERNRDVISDPDELRAGTVIRVGPG